MRMIEVLYLQPGKQPEKRMIKAELAAYQELVGGYIEQVHIHEGLVLVVNEEGLLKGLPACVLVADERGHQTPVVGSCFFARLWRSDYHSLNLRTEDEAARSILALAPAAPEGDLEAEARILTALAKTTVH